MYLVVYEMWSESIQLAANAAAIWYLWGRQGAEKLAEKNLLLIFCKKSLFLTSDLQNIMYNMVTFEGKFASLEFQKKDKTMFCE